MAEESRASVAPSRRDQEALAARVAGPVLLPGDDGWAEEAWTLNAAVDHRPAVIVGATGPADVQAAVRFARAHELAVGVVATGHGPAVTISGGLLITTRRMSGVAIDPVARTARVEAGVSMRQLVDEAAAFGLAPLAGSAPSLGVVGYTLGGGLSVTMGRAFGWAADHVRRIDVVTADGELRQASEATEPDLFWALRGGKGNFGVVTALECALFPVTRLYAGNLFFSGRDTASVMHAYQRFTAGAPQDLMSSIALLRMPDVPSVPELLRGRLTVDIRISYLGSADDGRKLIAPLRAAAPAELDTVTERPFTDFGQIAPGPAEPVPSVEQFALLRELTPQTVDAFVAAAGPDSATAVNVIDIRHLGGALTKQRTGGNNAVDPLDAQFLLITSTIVAKGQGEERKDAGLELLDPLAPWLREAKHANFLAASDATAQRTRKAFRAPTYERLRSVKSRFDPHNAFRFNHNIPPGQG
ncbi:FAD/FMN-containing dehydrogenase [Streptomyces sp. DvalAA-14]|uniref:FAD-binding oxidoreductase n=1 Tax=unclassified Streptomyces TaxID=2593676 RepID=UPI00081B42C0|nr:FAD-binding oxidoreductase [Streptomyces sp. DvalAA-14]SCD46003.1 FAD/FMN-containing dehydrogenase [Streptomyces sp. DvalAA-14]